VRRRAHLVGSIPGASYPAFVELRQKYGRPDLPFQVGVPGHLDLSLDAFGFGEGFAPEYYRPCLQATLGQVRKIAATASSDVVFQLETPAALIAVAAAGEDAAAETARQVAALTAELPAARPRAPGSACTCAWAT
jgi:hypothetical protein